MPIPFNQTGKKGTARPICLTVAGFTDDGKKWNAEQ
jgi:hypothetical protein